MVTSVQIASSREVTSPMRRSIRPKRASFRPPPSETSRSPRGKLRRMNDVTRILSAIEHGDPQAAEQLLPLVYDELRKLAAQKLAQEKPGQTLQATALVHEAYLRLVDADRGPALEQPRPLLRRRRRGHAPHPRRERPPQATRRSAAAAGSGVDLDERPPASTERPRTTCWPSTRPWTQLARQRRRRRAELVKLRYFAGLTHRGGRPRRSASRRATADRHWAYARAWLLRAMLAASRRPGASSSKNSRTVAQIGAGSRTGWVGRTARARGSR